MKMCKQHSTVLLHHHNDRFRIDPCMREEISSMRDWGIKTLACCCGHGKHKKTVVVETPSGAIDYYTKIPIPRKTRFYKRDKDGIFYIPEVEEKLEKPKP